MTTLMRRSDMQELEKILKEIEAEFDRRIGTQLQIMGGLGDDVYRYGYGKSLEAYQQGKLFVQDIIQKHMNGDWIPVEDRLPEEDGFYLVSLDIPTNIDDLKVSKTWFSEKTKSFSEYGKRVTAWRSIPDPYQPEKDN